MDVYEKHGFMDVNEKISHTIMRELVWDEKGLSSTVKLIIGNAKGSFNGNI